MSQLPNVESDIYLSAFSGTSGKITKLSLTQLQAQLQRIESSNTIAPFTGAVLASNIISPTPIVGTTTLSLTNVSQYPPLSFSVLDDDITFNQLGTYNISVSGTVTGTPGIQSAITLTAVPTGSTTIVGTNSMIATTNSAGLPGTFDYPFLATTSLVGDDIFFTATTASSNVSIINGSVNIVKAA